MTYEYRDAYGRVLTADHGLDDDDNPMAVLWSCGEFGASVPVRIPADRVEEVVAGIRDAARQTTPVGPCGCGSPATPDVVHCQGAPCYMDQEGGLQTVELPFAAARQTTGQDDTGVTCAHCQGTGADPEDQGDYEPSVHMYNPTTIGPCPECHGTGKDTPAVGQPAEAHDTDTSTWWTIQAQKPTGTWFNLSEGFSSANEARAWRDTEITEPRNWPLRIVRVDQTETVAVEDER